MARDFLEDVEFKGKAVGIAPTADLELATKKYVDDKEVADNAITNAKLADMAGNTVKARVGGSSGDPGDLALGSHSVLGRNNGDVASLDASNDTVLRRNTGNTLGFGKVGSNHLETEVTASLDLADTAVQPASTDTLTNKRITKRTGTVASSATPTINTDNVDYYTITALAVNITSMSANLSGTPTEGQTLWITITGTATRAIAWGSSFENGSVELPTTTDGTTPLDVGFRWNSATSKWRVMASNATVAGNSGGSSPIVHSEAVATDVAINSTTAVTVLSKSISNIEVGDIVEVEISGNIWNNSTATRTYIHTFTLGETTFSLTDGTTVAFSATARSAHEIKFRFAVISTSNIHFNTWVSRGVPQNAGIRQAIATTTVSHLFNTSTNNETGTKNVVYACRGQNVTATQTFELRTFKISLLKKTP